MLILIFNIYEDKAHPINLKAANVQKKRQHIRPHISKNMPQDIKALVKAASIGSTAKVIALLDKGVGVNAKAPHNKLDEELELAGQTALMAAAGNGHVETVRLLLKRGANVNIKHEVGGTALTGAVATGHLEVVKTLLDAGADLNVIISDQHAGPYTVLMLAMNLKNKHWLEIIDALIAAGAKINPTNGFQLSPLWYAISREDTTIVEALVKRGANVNLRDAETGSTPLMEAAKYSSFQVVQALIDAGADVNAKDNEGKTALVIAEEDKENSWQSENVRLLKQAGVKE